MDAPKKRLPRQYTIRWNQALASLAGVKRSLRSLESSAGLAALAGWNQAGGFAALERQTAQTARLVASS